MAQRIFKSREGFSDKRVSWLSAVAIGGDVNQDAAGVGSICTLTDGSGDRYVKKIAGAGAGNWERLPTLTDLTAATNADPWREPARIYTEQLLSAVQTDINIDDIIDGVTIVANDRILINDGSASPNVYIVSGSTGAWTLTEDANNETAGDVVKVLDGTKAGNEYTFNGTNWIWTGHQNASEDGFQNTYIGKSSVGGATPTYTSTTVVANADSLTTAVGKLDAESAAISSSLSTISGTAGAAQAELDVTQTSLGTAIAANGTYAGFTGSNILDASTSVTDALSILDTQVNTNTGAISTNATAISTNATDIGNVQAELDVTQTGAGLSVTGSYTANGGANYISTATSLHNADQLLDTQIKSVADSVAALGSGSIAAIQSELDAVESSLGASVTTSGTFNVSGFSASILSASTSVTDAINITALHSESAQSEVDAIETALGGMVSASGVYVPFTGTNYVDSATSVTGAISALDTQAKANADAIVTNAGNIATNTSAIATNATNIATNTGNIATNTSDIATIQTTLADELKAVSATGINTFVADSVLTDAVIAAKWLLTVTNPANGDRVALVVTAAHNGYGVNDATASEETDYAELEFGNEIPGLQIDAVLSGTGAAQTMDLQVTAAVSIDVVAKRLIA